MADEENPYPAYFADLPPWLRTQAEGAWDNGHPNFDGSQLPATTIDSFTIAEILPTEQRGAVPIPEEEPTE